MIILEICVDSVESAIAAELGGAQRVELCSALSEGGLTPSLGMIRAVRSRLNIGVHVMIRPRNGDFLYSDEEFAVMKEDIRLVSECGVSGVVFGVLTPDSEVNVERTRALVELARPMEVTFHRALDMTRDVISAFEDVIRTGADRVLTSGGQANAILGRSQIRQMVESSRGRIRVMAGGGVRPENAVELAQATGAMEFHASLRCAVSGNVVPTHENIRLVSLDCDDHARSTVLTEDVQNLHFALASSFIQTC